MNAFVGTYDIGSLLSFKGIAEGVENSNFLVHTEKAYFILTLYEKRVNPDDLPYFLNLLQHLATKGLSCAAACPLKRRQVSGHIGWTASGARHISGWHVGEAAKAAALR